VEEPKIYKAWPEGRPHSIDYPVIPVYQFLNSTAVRRPDTVALRFGGMELTYQEVLTLTHRFANALRSRGVKKGDRVAIHLVNSPQFMIAYYALLKLGAVFVPCSPLSVDRELIHQIVDSGAETLITLDLFFGTVGSVLEKTGVKNLIVTSLADCYPVATAQVKMLKKIPIDKGEDFVALLEEGSPDPVNEPIDPKRDLAHLAYTGGTTGLAKGVMLTHYNVAVNTMQCYHWFAGGVPVYEDGILTTDMSVTMKDFGGGTASVGEGFVALVVVPWFHAMGVVGYLNQPVYAASTMIVFARFDPTEYLRAVDKYKANILGGAPQLYIPLVEHPDFKKVDTSRIVLAVSGAAPLPREVLKKMLSAFSGLVTEAFGMTETSMLAIANPPSREALKPGSVGLPVFDTDAKVVDISTGAELGPGKDGEICVRGPQNMQGYWNNPEETARTLIDGWIHTGDVGYYDEDGYFFITDRKKDMIIYKGYNVYPRQIEEVLFEHPSVVHCGVVGKPDEHGGEIPVAFVKLAEGAHVTEQQIMDFANERLAHYKHVREVRFVDDIPTNMAGKVLKRVLRQRL
jgi:long-chain acyl-CoA synthetase